MQHRGEIVEKAVRESGFPIAELARRRKKSRRHIYNLFETPILSLDKILQIGEIINVYFRDRSAPRLFYKRYIGLWIYLRRYFKI
jgi:hypothetical protein